MYTSVHACGFMCVHSQRVACMHARVCMYTHISADVYICMCLCTCIGVCMYAYVHVCANIEVCACMGACLCVSEHVEECVFVSVSVWDVSAACRGVYMRVSACANVRAWLHACVGRGDAPVHPPSQLWHLGWPRWVPALPPRPSHDRPPREPPPGDPVGGQPCAGGDSGDRTPLGLQVQEAPAGHSSPSLPSLPGTVMLTAL